MKKTRINPGSAKQAERDAQWKLVCAQRRGKLKAKYGYLIDEWTGKRIEFHQRTEGHHNDRDRGNNTLDNCRIVSIVSHRYITDHSVRDVPDRLNETKPKKIVGPTINYLSGYGHGQSFSREQQVGKG